MMIRFAQIQAAWGYFSRIACHTGDRPPNRHPPGLENRQIALAKALVSGSYRVQIAEYSVPIFEKLLNYYTC